MKAGKTKYEFEFIGGNTIVIRRTLPDKSEKFVGCIIREADKASHAISYKSFDMDGNEILPPTPEFGPAALQFESHLLDAENKTKTMATRKAELKKVRHKKVQKKRGLQR